MTHRPAPDDADAVRLPSAVPGNGAAHRVPDAPASHATPGLTPDVLADSGHLGRESRRFGRKAQEDVALGQGRRPGSTSAGRVDAHVPGETPAAGDRGFTPDVRPDSGHPGRENRHIGRKAQGGGWPRRGRSAGWTSSDARPAGSMRGSMRQRLTGRHLTRRVVQLYAGLITYGVSMALFVRSDLGNMPWDVFHQGLVVQLGGTIGRWSIVVGAIVLLLWIPLRERPGLGTVSNVFVIGIFVDLTLSRLPELDHLAGRIGYVAAGVLLNALATAAYIGARFGSGPRDGLMTGFTRRTRFSLRVVRTTIEVVVVVTGWLLGGTLGVATIVYAVAIGPLVQLMLEPFTVPADERSQPGPVPPVQPIGPDTLAA